jgi:hypothetical protein
MITAHDCPDCGRELALYRDDEPMTCTFCEERWEWRRETPFGDRYVVGRAEDVMGGNRRKPHHIEVTFTTDASLTSIQTHQLVREMGDEHFWKHVEDFTITPAIPERHIVGRFCFDVKDPETGGRVDGMEIEAAMYLRAALFPYTTGEASVEAETTIVDERYLP